MSFDPNTARLDEGPAPTPVAKPQAPTGLFDPRTAIADDAPPAREVVRQAVKVKPEAAAEADRLSRRYPAPYEVVKRNADDFQMFDIAERVSDELSQAPHLTAAFRNNPRVAELAHDDVPTLAKIERTIGNATRYVMGAGKTKPMDDLRAADKAAQEGLTTIGLGATVGVGKMAFDIFGAAVDLLGLDEMAANARNNAKRAGEAMDAEGLQPTTSTGKAIKSGLQSAGTNLALLPAGLARGLYATASQAATTVAGLMGAGVGADAYNEARDKGKGKAASLAYGIPQGVFEFVFEKIPAQKLFGDLASNAGLMQTLKHQAFSEVWTEQMTTLAQDFNTWMNLNPERTLADFIAERPEAAYQTLVATLVGVGVQTTTIHGINKAVEKATDTRLQFEQDLLEEQMKLAATSALRERSPEQFRTLMARIVETSDAPQKSIHVDAHVLNQLGEDVLAQLPESVRAQIPAEAAKNGTVEISIADVLTVAPGTPLEQVLNDNARMTPEALSRADALAAGDKAQVLRQEAEQVIQQAQDQAAAQADYDQVRQMYAQQVAASGRYRPAVADAMGHWLASFYTAYGARTGMTATEMQARYPVRVLGAAPAGGLGDVMDQITPEQARATNVQLEMPTDPTFAEAVANTPGAEVTADGLAIDLVRFQKEEQEGAQAIRTGVFYLPAKSPNAKHYRVTPTTKSPNAYGGSEKMTGQTLIRRPLFVKGGTGGKAPEAAYDAIKGKGASKVLGKAVMAVVTSRGFMNRIDAESFLMNVKQFLGDNGGEQGFAREIAENSKQGNTLRYALQEHVIAHAVRAAGYDAVVGYTKGKAGAGISEVFDVREQTYPARGMDSQVHDVFEQRAFANETGQDRANSRGVARVSPRMPTAKKATEDAMGDTRLQPDLETAKRDPAIFEHNIGLMLGYPNFEGLEGTTEEQAEAIIQHSVDNLLWLHDHWAPGYRDRSRMWYVGGNRIAHRWAKQFGVTPEQVAAVIAATSPQKDWFQNVSLAERILDAVIYNADVPWDAKMTALVQQRDWGKKEVQDPSVYVGKTLRELFNSGTPGALLDMSIWIRAWDEANNPMKARVITPEGGFTANFDAGKSGKEIGLRWQSFPTIVKTLQVLMTNDRAMLSEIIGANHKVRSFYNNIIAPYAGDDVTIDTHAVAAALLRPLGSSSTEVFHNFGSGEPGSVGPKNSAITGLYGTYAIYAEAYRRAAAQRDILPREMQSITWEAVRGLFRPEQKNEKIRAESDRLWAAAARGEISAEDARQAIEKLVGGIVDPAWVRSPAGTNEAGADSSYASKLHEARRVEGTADGRGGVDAAAGTQPGGRANGVLNQASTALDENGRPEIQGDGVFIGFGQPAERLEFIPANDGEEMLNQAIMAPDGAYQGYVEATYRDGKPVAIYDIYVDPDSRKQGVGARAVAAMLEASGGSLQVSNVVPAAQGFWEKVGVPIQNVEEGAAYDGTITTEDFNASAAGQKRNRARGPLGQRESAGPQGPRGTFNPATLELVLNPNANLSTFFHETGHFFLEVVADIASQANAPAQIVEDMGTFLKWAGIADLQTWRALDLDGKRAAHERWAESIEQYVMEGRAPSVELQPLMRRFATWLKSVYGSIKQFLASKPEADTMALNDDIRRVMDRMLATDQQIAQANEVSGLLPDLEADALAAERLNKRSMADLKWSVRALDAVIMKLRKQAKAIEKTIRAEVIAEVNAMREVQAEDLLAKSQKDNDGKLNETERAIIADAFSYGTVDEMLQSIDAFGSKADVIDGMTQQRMLEEHGDLTDDNAIRQAALEAVHNEARARSLATELRTQSEMLNPRTDTGETNTKGSKITVNALIEAAKQFAANVVARTPLRDLKSKAWQHTAAERRAGQRWATATAAGKTQDAVQAKQDQMLNHAAAKAALDARQEMGKILEFFKRVVKGNDEKVVEKGRDADVVNAARAVLAAYGIETPASKGADAYLEVLQRNDPETHGVIMPMVQGALQNAQPIEALTFEELQALHEEIQAMWYLAKRSRQSEIDGNLLDRDDLAQELRARMEEIGIPDRVPGEGKAVTKAEDRALFLRQGVSFLRRIEQWAEGFDGKYGGPFLRYVFQPVKDAANRYRADRTAYRKKLQALVDNITPIVGDQIIKSPELRYEFGTPGSTKGTAMNEVLHAIAHTGNESNKRKLLLGRGWATENPDGTLDTSKWDAFIARLITEGKLEQAHFDFVQGLWDLMEETKPLAQKAHRDAFGRYFAEVTADAFVDPFGVPRRGGYAPAIVDAEQVKDNELRKLAESENENMAFAFPAPGKGFTKGRVEYNRPLLLDLRTLSQHLDKVLLFSHMTGPARDVRRLITDKSVGQALTRIDPSVTSGMLQPWLQRSAQQVVEDPIVGAGKWARVPSIIRARAGAALMFANVSNTIQQVTGLSTALVKVGPAHMMRAVAQHVAHPVKSTRAVWEASTYMDDRAKNEVAVMNEQLQDILLNPSVYEKAQAWSMRNAYFLQTAVDNALSPIVWTGAYNQAMTEGMTHDDAVRFADGTVRQTQGSTLPEDVSRFETGPAYARAFTQFIGYFNMVANTNATALQQIAGEVGLKKGAGRALGVVMAGLLVPLWVAEAIAQAFRGGPDDEDKDGYLDDWLAAVFGFGTVKGLLAMIPIAGQAANSAVSRLDNNPMNDRISLSPGLSLLESALGGNVQTVSEILDGDKEVNARRAVRDAATLVSVFTGLPAYAVARPVGYLAGIADDKIEPTGPLDVARGLVTGVPSPDSKVK